MKRISFSLFLCLLTFVLQAQNDSTEIAAGKKLKGYVGLAVGLNSPTMHYSSNGLNDYKSEIYFNTLYGIFAEFPLDAANRFWIRPEIDFLTRGQHIKKDVEYTMDAHYVNLAVPFSYCFSNENASAIPYLALAPSLGLATGGKIKLDEQSTKITGGNLNPLDFGIYGGLGIKIPIKTAGREILRLGIEAGYYFGLANTYSEQELDNDAKALNVNFYDLEGESRSHRGFQVKISASVPLNIFQTKKKPAPTPIPVVIEPTPIVEVKEVVKEEKPCFSLEEMQQFIRNGESVAGKKICAISQINFEFGKSDIKKQSQAYLNNIVALMAENPSMNIVINGHTDNIGSAESNMTLSRNRAKAVYDYLVKKGIDSSRLTYQYYGLERPIATNDTEEGRERNRRVE
ncbi:MAG: OmpA family protein, partial [Dysgonamonadaceae bacterium]|nr:OmpA family protein [Dysgonamonadaceae bacterium]